MKYLVCIFSLVSSSLLAQENFSNESVAHRTTETPVYYKPGADVTFAHTYDGISRVAEDEQFTLQFSSHSVAEGDTLTIRLNPSSALELAGEEKFELTPVDHRAELPITLRATQNGLHYLGVHAEVVDAGGQRSFRVFELPIQVGDPKNNVKVSRHKVVQSAEGRKLVILESTETVR